ncbi:putative tetratricopeptide-like helical domain superfamily [Helianthus annuus]|nr:putative tetratricopeptide-like helical domain superfamily [Helianthus annuus]
MIRSRLRLDQYTLVSILVACSGLASLTEGKQTHALVFKHRLDTHVSIANALITMYSKCGCLLEVKSVFQHICTPNIVSQKTLGFFKKIELHGIEPNGIRFLSLLSACGHAGIDKFLL